MREQDEKLKSYQDAVWDYILEHCDITERGSYFVKFHTDSRATFEKHIRARWKHGYHRKDERMNLTHKQKELDATARKKAHESRKEVKKRKHKDRVLSHREQQKAFAELKRQRELKEQPAIIHTANMRQVAQKWYNKIKYYVIKIAKIKK